MLKKSRVKIVNLILILIIIISIAVILLGLTKIIKAKIELKEGLKEVEEVFGDASSISNSNNETNLETKIENEEDNSSLDNTNPNKAIGLITFKLEKEYKTAIYENITEETLRKGAGRATGTSKLNASGNCVLYGHRDSAFRALWDIKIGDIAEVRTVKNIKKYKVQKIYITTPEDEKIFNQDLDNEESILTLVTCYPFVYSGPANKRCVVEMTQISAAQTVSKLQNNT